MDILKTERSFIDINISSDEILAIYNSLRFALEALDDSDVYTHIGVPVEKMKSLMRQFGAASCAGPK